MPYRIKASDKVLVVYRADQDGRIASASVFFGSIAPKFPYSCCRAIVVPRPSITGSLQGDQEIMEKFVVSGDALIRKA